MIIKSIRYSNYRCFRDGEIIFQQDKDRNINLILGDNGGGKTEILFSFWWIFYGFDFSTLQGKDDTPYALNSALHREIEAEHSKRHNCEVEINFCIDEEEFILKKTEQFAYSQRANRVESTSSRVLFSIKKNGETELPLREEKEIMSKLSKIVPKKILYGIVFDGERMKQLSSFDDNSIKAIEGVIQDITNIDLLEQCVVSYTKLENDNYKAYKKIGYNANENVLKGWIGQLALAKNGLNTVLTEITNKTESLNNLTAETEYINKQLSEYRESRDLSIKRTEKEKNKKNLEIELKKAYQEYAEELKNAYLLNATKVFEVVKNTTDKVDVPAGLLVQAVKSILQREFCICGNPLGETERETLQLVIQTLPPDNVNSTITEMNRQILERSKLVQNLIKKARERIVTKEKELTSVSVEIQGLSKLITTSGIEEAKKLEEKYLLLRAEKIKLENAELPELKKERDNYTRAISDLENSIDKFESKSSEAAGLEKERKYISKALEAFKKIKMKAKELALRDIDRLFQDAFETLSEDAVLGRRACIVKYDTKSKYKLVTYYESDYLKQKIKFEEADQIEKWEVEGLTPDQIKEKIINKCKEAKSTGQSKIVTLSFVKAILDYSRRHRNEEGIEEQKEYPLLIDAPFSDISGHNLNNTAEALPGFSNQIILMLAKDSYDSVRRHLSKHISTMHILDKNENMNNSSIRREENVDLCK